MAEKRKGNSPDHKKIDNDERKKRRRYNPRLQSAEPDDLVRSRGRKPTKKYNPKAGMSTTPSPPVQYNQGTQSVLSVSDLTPVDPPRRGRPRKSGRGGQSVPQPENKQRPGRDSRPHPQLPPPPMQSRGSSSSHNPVGRSMYGGEERPSGVLPFYDHRFDQELHHNLFQTVNPFGHSDTSIIFDGCFGGMVQNNMDPMHNNRGGGSGMHPARFGAFELGLQCSPSPIDQRSTSSSPQWPSDALSRVVSVNPEGRHFPPTHYLFSVMPPADPHWPLDSSDPQGAFMSGIGIEEPVMVNHAGLAIEQFSSSQPYSGVASNLAIGPSQGSSHQPSQSQNSQSMRHEIQMHIPCTDRNCPVCQHIHTSGWESR